MERYGHGREGVGARNLHVVQQHPQQEHSPESPPLQRLEQQGHVTRDLTLGSHQGYPVVTQNYEAKIRELSRYPDGSIVKGENGSPSAPPGPRS